MNTIVMMTLLCTIAFVIFMIIYLTPYFSKKQIKNGKFDILQFINLFFAPILVIPFFYYLRKIIFQNLRMMYSISKLVRTYIKLTMIMLMENLLK